MEPPDPAVAVMVFDAVVKEAEILWEAVTPVNVYESTLPTEDPSTSTLATAYPVFGEMVNIWLPPLITETEPDGDMDPPADADAVIL